MKGRGVSRCVIILLLSCFLMTCKDSTPAPAKNTYNVIYYGNGSMSGNVEEQTAEEGSVLYIRGAENLSWKCHAFESWNTSKDGKGTTYNPGDAYTVERNLVLFAQWNDFHDWESVERQDASCFYNGWKDYRRCRACGLQSGYEELTATHDFITKEAKASTCSEQGWKEYQECKVCGYSTKILLPLLDHYFIEVVTEDCIKSKATCTEKAIYYKSCSFCGFKSLDTFTYGVALGHNLQTNGAKVSTCLEQGWNSYESCTNCQYSSRELLPLADHIYAKIVDYKYLSENATCSKRAVYYVSCSVCGQKGTETFNGGMYLAHELVHTDAREPNCITKGWNAYDTCIRCKYTTYVEKSALGHDIVHHNERSATCVDSGYKAYDTCTRCSYTTYSSLPALGHDYVNHDACSPTCTAPGWNAYKTCLRCDFSTYIEEDALGHDSISHSGMEPTCLSNGWEDYFTCSRCDFSTYAVIPAEGHRYTFKDAKASTCTEQGWNSYQQCSKCGYSTKTLLPYAMHVPEETAAEKYLKSRATCINPATYYESCRVCGAKLDNTFTYGPVLGHDFVDHTAKEPGCCDIGWENYFTCSRCDYTTYNKISALGHSFVKHEGKDATCTEDGYSEYEVCIRCGYSTAIKLPAYGHTYLNHAAKSQTCTESGWDEYVTCSQCDYTTFVEKKALGHSTIRYEAKDPTCTEIGWATYSSCLRCDYSTYVELPAKGHSYSTEWSINTDYHWHSAICEHTDLKSDKATHTWNLDNMCTMCGIQNAGSGVVTIEPAEYKVSLELPEDWSGNLHVVPQVKGTIKASLVPSTNDVDYTFFLDGIKLSTTGDELVFGKEAGEVELDSGYHVLIIIASFDGVTYQNRYVIQVSSAGAGTPDTEGGV